MNRTDWHPLADHFLVALANSNAYNCHANTEQYLATAYECFEFARDIFQEYCDGGLPGSHPTLIVGVDTCLPTLEAFNMGELDRPQCGTKTAVP